MRKLSLIPISLGVLMIIGVSVVMLNTNKSTHTTTNQTVATTKQTRQPANKQAIVIYMTHTGNTESVANAIQKQTGALPVINCTLKRPIRLVTKRC